MLPGGVSGGAVAGAGAGGRETVPEVEFLLLDAWLARLVGFDVVGEEIAPVIVGHVIHVGLRTRGYAVFFDGADVVGFPVVIPGKNLLCQFPSQFRQMKGGNEILVCSPLRIEVALLAPAASGCATYRLRAMSSSCRTGAAWCRTRGTLASCMPLERWLTSTANRSRRFCQRRPQSMRPS